MPGAYADAMTQSPVVRRASVQLTERAVAALVTELARHAGPKSGLVIGARVGSPVLLAALDALRPDDQLTLVARGDSGTVRAFVADRGAWVAQRVRVVDALDDADAADVVIVA